MGEELKVQKEKPAEHLDLLPPSCLCLKCVGATTRCSRGLCSGTFEGRINRSGGSADACSLLLWVSIIHIVSWRAGAGHQPGAVSHHHTQSRACQNGWSHRLSTVEEHWAVIHILLPRQASLNPGPATKCRRLIKEGAVSKPRESHCAMN